MSASYWVPFVGIMLAVMAAPDSPAIVAAAICGTAVASYLLVTGTRSVRRGRALFGAVVLAVVVAGVAGFVWLWETRVADDLIGWLDIS